MEFDELVRATGACRYFTSDPVPDEVLARLFEAARFGPQGGNRQPVRYVVIRDPEVKARLGGWYREVWDSYSGGYRAGQGGSAITESADHLARNFGEVPVLVVVGAVLDDLLRPDADLDRPGIVGGASVYPSVQNLLLAARQEGLGATLTTLLCRFEPQVKELLGIPDEVITAATVTLGYPARSLPTRLTRRPAEEVVFADRYGNRLFA
ncbi:MAG: nitroreductase family protein [Acidimicrobiia bacterium]